MIEGILLNYRVLESLGTPKPRELNFHALQEKQLLDSMAEASLLLLLMVMSAMIL